MKQFYFYTSIDRAHFFVHVSCRILSIVNPYNAETDKLWRNYVNNMTEEVFRRQAINSHETEMEMFLAFFR